MLIKAYKFYLFRATLLATDLITWFIKEFSQTMSTCRGYLGCKGINTRVVSTTMESTVQHWQDQRCPCPRQKWARWLSKQSWGWNFLLEISLWLLWLLREGNRHWRILMRRFQAVFRDHVNLLFSYLTEWESIKFDWLMDKFWQNWLSLTE